VSAVGEIGASALPSSGAGRLPVRRSLLRGGTLVLASTLVWHASNFAFNSVTARTLGPAKYSELAAAVALLYLASPLLVSLQAVSSGAATSLTVAGETDRIRGTLAFHLRRLAFTGALAAGGIALASTAIARFLRVDSGVPIAILGVGLWLSVLTHCQRGVLQGTMRFGRYAASTLTEAAVKIGATVVLVVAVSRTVESAVLSVAIAAAVALVVNTALLLFLPAGMQTNAATSALARHRGPALATFVLLAVLLSADVLAAKRYLPAAAAGVYASVSLSGKVVFFATSALSLVLFPHFTERRQHGLDARRELLAATAAVSACSGVLAGLYFVVPGAVVRPLFGGAFGAAEPYLGWIAIAFGCYAVVYLAATYLLANGRWVGAAVLAVAVLAQLAGLYSVHDTVGHVVAVQLVVLAGAAAALLVTALRGEGDGEVAT